MFDNLISSDSQKKNRSWSPASVIGSLIIIALVITGAVYASTSSQKKQKQEQKKKIVSFKIAKPKPKPKKPKPKPKPKKPKPKPKPKKPTPNKKPKGFQQLHTPAHISNKIPEVNLNAKAVKTANFSGMGVVGGTAKGHGHGGKGKKGGQGHGGLHTVFMAVQQMPNLKGGIKELQSHVVYPRSCANAGIQGRVIVQFIVNTKGVPTHIHVVRGIGGGCDEAAVKAIKKYARFTPGMQQGTAVPVRMSLPVVFRLRQ